MKRTDAERANLAYKKGIEITQKLQRLEYSARNSPFGRLDAVYWKRKSEAASRLKTFAKRLARKALIDQGYSSDLIDYLNS